jgi:hypothetical protein
MRAQRYAWQWFNAPYCRCEVFFCSGTDAKGIPVMKHVERR